MVDTGHALQDVAVNVKNVLEGQASLIGQKETINVLRRQQPKKMPSIQVQPASRDHDREDEPESRIGIVIYYQHPKSNPEKEFTDIVVVVDEIIQVLLADWNADGYALNLEEVTADTASFEYASGTLIGAVIGVVYGRTEPSGEQVIPADWS